jgi:hypothetical protein
MPDVDERRGLHTVERVSHRDDAQCHSLTGVALSVPTLRLRAQQWSSWLAQRSS